MKVNPYLNFPGNTEEAFNFYKEVFGGEFSAIVKFGDMPESAESTPEEFKNKIMYIALPISDEVTLMATDAVEEMGQHLEIGNNMYVCISPDSIEEGKRIFDTLSAGGNIEMEYQKMFWGSYFASFKDKYGISWMIDIADNQN